MDTFERYVRIVCGFDFKDIKRHYLSWFTMLGVGGYLSAAMSMILDFVGDYQVPTILLVLLPIMYLVSTDPSNCGKKLQNARHKRLPKDWEYLPIPDEEEFYLEFMLHLETGIHGDAERTLASLSNLAPPAEIRKAMSQDGICDLIAPLFLDAAHYIPCKYYRFFFTFIEAVTRYITPIPANMSRTYRDAYQKNETQKNDTQKNSSSRVPSPLREETTFRRDIPTPDSIPVTFVSKDFSSCSSARNITHVVPSLSDPSISQVPSSGVSSLVTVDTEKESSILDCLLQRHNISNLPATVSSLSSSSTPSSSSAPSSSSTPSSSSAPSSSSTPSSSSAPSSSSPAESNANVREKTAEKKKDESSFTDILRILNSAVGSSDEGPLPTLIRNFIDSQTKKTE